METMIAAMAGTNNSAVSLITIVFIVEKIIATIKGTFFEK